MDQLVETYPTMWVQLCLWLAKELIINDNIFVLLYYSRKSQFFFFFFRFICNGSVFHFIFIYQFRGATLGADSHNDLKENWLKF